MLTRLTPPESYLPKSAQKIAVILCHSGDFFKPRILKGAYGRSASPGSTGSSPSFRHAEEESWGWIFCEYKKGSDLAYPGFEVYARIIGDEINALCAELKVAPHAINLLVIEANLGFSGTPPEIEAFFEDAINYPLEKKQFPLAKLLLVSGETPKKPYAETETHLIEKYGNEWTQHFRYYSKFEFGGGRIISNLLLGKPSIIKSGSTGSLEITSQEDSHLSAFAAPPKRLEAAPGGDTRYRHLSPPYITSPQAAAGATSHLPIVPETSSHTSDAESREANPSSGSSIPAAAAPVATEPSTLETVATSNSAVAATGTPIPLSPVSSVSPSTSNTRTCCPLFQCHCVRKIHPQSPGAFT